MSSAFSLERPSVADHDPSQLAGTILGGGFLTLVGGVVGAVLQAFRKPSSTAEVITAATAAAKSVIGDLHTEVERLTEKVEKLDREHAGCREELAASRAEREELRREINKLMDGRIAQPGERDPYP